MASLMHVILQMTLATIAFCLCSYGWGKIFCKVVRIPLTRFFWPAMGIVAILIISGPLVLLHLADKTVLQIITAIGCIAAIGDVFVARKIFKQNFLSLFRPATNLCIFCFIFFLLSIFWLGTLSGFHQYADKVGYAVNVERLVQLGQYGPDPFNSRILESSLGGFNLLMGTLVSSGLNIYQLRILERAIAPLFIILTTLGILRQSNANRITIHIILLLECLLVMQGFSIGESGTLTGTYTAIPLYLIFLWLISKYWFTSYRMAICLACICASICLLKNTHFVALGMLCFGIILSLRSEAIKKYLLKNYLLFILFAAIIILPWMINMKISSGTFLYPLLGTGYHGSVYGIYYKASILENIKHVYCLKVLAMSCLLLLPMVGIAVFSPSCPNGISRSANISYLAPRFKLMVTIALFFGGLIFIAKTCFIRYLFLFEFLIAIIGALGLTNLQPGYFKKARSVLLMLSFIVFMILFQNPLFVFLGNIKQGITSKGQMEEVISRKDVLGAQSAIPENAMILARMGQAYFLDFKRNPVWHIDIPGSSCPPPGLPLDKGPAELKEYLQNLGVKYILYSAMDHGGHSPDKFMKMKDSQNSWEKSSIRSMLKFDDLMRHMNLACHVDYDKNGLIVYNLELAPENNAQKTGASPEK